MSRPLSAPQLTSMRPRSQEQQGLDLWAQPLFWGVRGLILAAAARGKAQVEPEPLLEMDGANRAPRQ